MATVSALLTQLQKRLGITSPSARESDRLTEALYAGIARATSDGIPGLAHSLVTAETYGEGSATVSSHSGDSADITLNAIPTGTRAGDLMKIGGNVYSIYSIASLVVSVGAPIKDAIAGSTAVTIYHRTVELPNTGPVHKVFDLTNDNNIPHEPNGFVRYGFDTGTPAGYEVTYDRDNEETVVALWPAPSSATRLAIVQGYAWDTISTSTDLPYPVSALEAVLERATAAWRLWQVGGISPMELEASRVAVKDAETGLNQGGNEPIVRDSLRGRGRRN